MAAESLCALVASTSNQPKSRKEQIEMEEIKFVFDNAFKFPLITPNKIAWQGRVDDNASIKSARTMKSTGEQTETSMALIIKTAMTEFTGILSQYREEDIRICRQN